MFVPFPGVEVSKEEEDVELGVRGTTLYASVRLGGGRWPRP